MGMERYRIAAQPVAAAESVVRSEHWRVTVLTSRMLRLEYSETGVFEDRATQTVVCRAFPPVPFTAERRGGGLELRTEHLRLVYDGGPFTSAGLQVSVCSGEGSSLPWRYGMELHAFGGTARTLDGADGEIPLGDSLFSYEGCSVLDDSRSMALTNDGWVAPHAEEQDLYFFGFGRDFEGGLREFYRLCGPQPLLPRFALGCWWSRYHRYDEQEYLDLIDRFRREDLPFTVAVVDMDWHLVDIDPKYGTGWTGYTWNRDLFPDPPAFLRRLHERGMRLTLNVHPADGVRAFEDCYPAVARAMGVDPASRAPVAFDAADPKFMRVYFDEIHHPMEDDGVDFWWIDWQQGTETSIPGLDPLWMLNHYHYLDSARRGRRALTFTRYAGPGSHRYPVGFSGDTYITWDSLRFQPYFTSAASNVGFGWWSHDIGGHMGGGRDDELAARWVQLGVFSPVFRLHSMANEFAGKEPWNFGRDARETMNRFIRLRHALVPYLYSMNRDAHALGRPLVRPLYWADPDNFRLFSPELRNAFFFGTELLAAPITEPCDRISLTAKAKCLLPEGVWFDVFTGVAYRGGRELAFRRPIDEMPVFAKAGAIVPTQLRGAKWNDVSNPDALEVFVYPGADGAFTVWEDSDEADDAPGNWAETALSLRWSDAGEASFTVAAARGNLAAIPARRAWTLRFACVEDAPARVEGAEAVCSYDADARTLTVAFTADVTRDVRVTFPDGLRRAANPLAQRAREILMRAQISYDEKERLLREIERDGAAAAGAVLFIAQSDAVRAALLELLTAL